MKYAFIRSNAASFPVSHLSRLLAVQRCAYYTGRDRSTKIIGPEELELRRRMKSFFAESRASLSSRVMTANLRAEGFDVEPVRNLCL